MKTIAQILSTVFYICFVVVAFIASYVWEITEAHLAWVFKSYRRPICKKEGHEWVHHGSGFGPIPGPIYPFSCERCGKKSKGHMEDFDNKPFTAKIK